MIKLFFTNAVVNLKIPKIKNFVKVKKITLNEKYLYNLLKLKPNGSKVALGNYLINVIPTLIRETQLTIIFGPDFGDVNGILTPIYCLNHISYITWLLK